MELSHPNKNKHHKFSDDKCCRWTLFHHHSSPVEMDFHSPHTYGVEMFSFGCLLKPPRWYWLQKKASSDKRWGEMINHKLILDSFSSLFFITSQVNIAAQFSTFHLRTWYWYSNCKAWKGCKAPRNGFIQLPYKLKRTVYIITFRRSQRFSVWQMWQHHF